VGARIKCNREADDVLSWPRYVRVYKADARIQRARTPFDLPNDTALLRPASRPAETFAWNGRTSLGVQNSQSWRATLFAPALALPDPSNKRRSPINRG
jgi:hypothetical protein